MVSRKDAKSQGKDAVSGGITIATYRGEDSGFSNHEGSGVKWNLSNSRLTVR